MEKLREMVRRIDLYLASMLFLVRLEKKTGIPKAIIALVFVFLASLLTLVRYCGILMAHLVAVSYPGYLTYSVLKEKRGRDPEVLACLATYWLTLAVVDTIEKVLGCCLFQKIYLYHLMKIVFLIWCQHPGIRGVVYVYHAGIFPVLSTLHMEVSKFLRKYDLCGNADGGNCTKEN